MQKPDQLQPALVEDKGEMPAAPGGHFWEAGAARAALFAMPPPEGGLDRTPLGIWAIVQSRVAAQRASHVHQMKEVAERRIRRPSPQLKADCLGETAVVVGGEVPQIPQALAATAGFRAWPPEAETKLECEPSASAHQESPSGECIGDAIPPTSVDAGRPGMKHHEGL
jgi:hypothetical protein